MKIQIIRKEESLAWKCEYDDRLFGDALADLSLTDERVVEIGIRGMERVVAFNKKWGQEHCA